MKLINNLFDIISPSDSDIFRVRLNPDCIIYRAHFPELPITPGVCILQIGTEILERKFDTPLEITKVRNAKFLKVINPVDTPELTYRFTSLKIDDTHNISTSLLVEADGVVYSKLSFTLSPASQIELK